jgi:hypothetical protein
LGCLDRNLNTLHFWKIAIEKRSPKLCVLNWDLVLHFSDLELTSPKPVHHLKDDREVNYSKKKGETNAVG